MPCFSSASSIRVASQHHALRLNITHTLVHGSPSDTVHNVKGRLPKELDVLWLSDLTISLSGSLDGHQIPAHDMARSGLVRHLETQLKANADRLGLNNVSRPFVDDADGLSKLTLTPSRPLPHASRPHADLVSLHLAYAWKTVAGICNAVDSGHLVEEVNPFSPTLFLPAEMLLNRVTEQFLIYHLVGRYPLIFGHWCKRLDLEMQYFPSIGHSIMEIMTRSQNPQFLSKCKRLLKIARRHYRLVVQTCIAALSSCADDATAESSEMEMDHLPAMPALTDEQVLCESMGQLFRVGVPQRRFKPSAISQVLSFPQDDSDGLLSDADIDDEASWVELPEAAVSPRAVVAGSCEMFPEDVDVFAKENWPEVGMWRSYGADTSWGGHDIDAQSEESLIIASFPLASAPTRSPQAACSFALYHHLDPPANGSRYDVAQSAYVGEPESSGLFVNLTHSPPHVPHDHQYSETCGQLMEGVGTCQVGAESFETVDSLSEGVEHSDTITILLFEDGDAPRQRPDGAELTVDLDWYE